MDNFFIHSSRVTVAVATAAAAGNNRGQVKVLLNHLIARAAPRNLRVGVVVPVL